MAEQRKERQSELLTAFRNKKRADWAVHIFHTHNNEADAWAVKGVGGCSEEWKDDSNVVWSAVTGLSGFWDGSCHRGVCGAGVLIEIFHTNSGVDHDSQKNVGQRPAIIPLMLKLGAVPC